MSIGESLLDRISKEQIALSRAERQVASIVLKDPKLIPKENKKNVNELPDIHWNSIARCFADETTDYQSPILFEIDKIAKLTEGK